MPIFTTKNHEPKKIETTLHLQKLVHNSRIWYRSRANPPVRVRVVFERKADKNDQMITVASYKEVENFEKLQTVKVE